MSRNQKAPLLVFVLVAMICTLVVVDSMRVDAGDQQVVLGARPPAPGVDTGKAPGVVPADPSSEGDATATDPEGPSSPPGPADGAPDPTAGQGSGETPATSDDPTSTGGTGGTGGTGEAPGSPPTGLAGEPGSQLGWGLGTWPDPGDLGVAPTPETPGESSVATPDGPQGPPPDRDEGRPLAPGRGLTAISPPLPPGTVPGPPGEPSIEVDPDGGSTPPQAPGSTPPAEPDTTTPGTPGATPPAAHAPCRERARHHLRRAQRPCR